MINRDRWHLTKTPSVLETHWRKLLATLVSSRIEKMLCMCRTTYTKSMILQSKFQPIGLQPPGTNMVTLTAGFADGSLFQQGTSRGTWFQLVSPNTCEDLYDLSSPSSSRLFLLPMRTGLTETWDNSPGSGFSSIKSLKNVGQTIQSTGCSANFMRLRPCLAMSKSESDKGVDVRQLTVTHGGSSKNVGLSSHFCSQF